MTIKPAPSEAVAAFLALLPEHKCGLYIEHNPHRDVYETVEQYTDEYDADDWASEDERAKAVATNELWRIQWYPETPIGFSHLAASSLEALVLGLPEGNP